METSLIHVSDTHLGCNPYWLPEDSTDFTDALHQVTALACRRDVDAVIHTGDLFDNSDPDDDVVDEAISAFERLVDTSIGEDIPAYVVHGDHDISDGETPGVDKVCQQTHVERLGHEPTDVDDRISLFGLHNNEIRDQGERIGNNLHQPSEDSEAIVCLHEMPRAKNHGYPYDVSLPAIERNVTFDVRLFAGRHLHRTKRWKTPKDTTCCYPGLTVPTHSRYWDHNPVVYLYRFPEIGDATSKGVFLDSRPYFDVDITVGADDGIDDVASAVFDEIVEQDGGEPLDKPLSEAVLRVTLSGNGETISCDEVEEYFEDYGVYYATVDASNWEFLI